MRRDLNPGIKECYGVGLFWPEPEFPFFFLLFTALNEAFEVNEKKTNLCRKSESEPTGFQKAGAEDD